MFKELNIELYKKLFTIRSAENAIIRHYNENEMKCPVHQSMGSEAISVGILHALGDKSQVFSSYRSHATYLAKTLDIHGFFDEMYSRDCSRLKGICGSMHLSNIDKGYYLASAIVASQIPVATGTAFANQYKNNNNAKQNNKIVVVFFGDGATEEGVFFESINIACLKKLKMIFVCEDNSLAVHTKKEDRKGYKSITDIISKFDCHVFESDTTDVLKIYETTLQTVDLIEKNPKPVFMNLKYYRYLEHVGINEDFNAGYRTKEEFEDYIRKHPDPITVQRNRLLRSGIENDTIKDIEKKIDHNIDTCIQYLHSQLIP